MKAVIILAFALVAVASADYKVVYTDELPAIRNECKAELSIPDADFEEVTHHKFTSSYGPCYVRCMFEHLEYYTKDSAFLVHNINTQINDSHDQTELITSCIDNTITDPCQTTMHTFLCLGKALKAKNLSLYKPRA